MRALTDAIVDRLVADTTLTDLLAVYLGEPAVFAFTPVPPDAELPFGVVSAPASDTEIAAKDREHRSIVRAVSFYEDAEGSTQVVEDAAERARELLNRDPVDLTGSGWTAYLAQVDGPSEAPTDDTMYGRRLDVTYNLREAVA